MGQLRRLRVDELAEEGSPAVLDHPEHLLQLRVRVRDSHVRRQGHARRPQDRRQPGASRLARADVRQGRRHAEPARGSRSRPLPAQARRRARRRRLDARVVGRGARGHRRPHPQGDSGRPARRSHVPRRPAGRGRLRQPRAAMLGPRRPQQPHERLLLVGAARAFSVDRRGPAVARSRECEDDSAALVAPRVRPLLQPARAAHHRRPVARGEAHRHRSAPVEHVGEGQSVAAGATRYRGRAAARDRAVPDRQQEVQPRVRAPLGELGGVPRRRLARSAAHVRRLRRGAEAGLRSVHAGIRGDRVRRPSRSRDRSGRGDRGRGHGVFDA